MINRINLNTNNYNNYQNFTGNSENSSLSTKKKAVILASAAAGMTPALALLAKRKGFSLNPAKIFKTPIKNWALFKYAPENKAIQFEAPQIIAVASGSIAGGFVGGMLVDDKANMKAKKREVLNQILGNVLVPVGCVDLSSRLFVKHETAIQNLMPQFKNNSKKAIRIINKCLKNIPNVVCTISALGIGIYAGNKVSNLINEKLYHKKVERGIKASDFAPHVDDLCMATSMMNKTSNFGPKLGRIIPLALVVPGYETGIAQNND